jgi:hypothetical protein
MRSEEERRSRRRRRGRRGRRRLLEGEGKGNTIVCPQDGQRGNQVRRRVARSARDLRREEEREGAGRGRGWEGEDAGRKGMFRPQPHAFDAGGSFPSLKEICTQGSIPSILPPSLPSSLPSSPPERSPRTPSVSPLLSRIPIAAGSRPLLLPPPPLSLPFCLLHSCC